MHEFAGFGPVVNIADDVRSLGQQARLDEVRAEDMTQRLDSYEHQLDNKDLEEMAKPTEGGERKRRTVSSKCMKTSDLQHSFSATETLTDALCDTDRDWEQNVKGKGV